MMRKKADAVVHVNRHIRSHMIAYVDDIEQLVTRRGSDVQTTKPPLVRYEQSLKFIAVRRKAQIEFAYANDRWH